MADASCKRLATLVDRAVAFGAVAASREDAERVRQVLNDLAEALEAAALPGTSAVRRAVFEALGEVQALSTDRPASLASAMARLRDHWRAASAKPASNPRPAVSGVTSNLKSAIAVTRDAAADDELVMLQSDPELASMFIAEALDHLGSIEARTLQLEAAPGDRRILDDIFRPFHTIKGNAGALGLSSVQTVAHTVESLLELGRSGTHRFGPAGIDVVLTAVDVLNGMLHGLAARLAGGAAPDLSDARAQLTERVARLIEEGESAQALDPDEALKAAIDEATHGGADHSQSSVKVETRKLDSLVDMVGELMVVQSIISEHPALERMMDERLGRHMAELRRITRDLQRNAMSLRMVPIRQTFHKMARLVRDLTRRSGKTVDLVLEGEDTELDRRVVEEINDPLIHMIRNSVDHGIESAEERRHAGKPPVGRLTLSAFHQGGAVVIAIEDDGRGLDEARIRSKAVAQGLIGRDADLTSTAIHRLIFQPGFSTAERVTEISGRGVGMDVVRRNIEALRGRIDIRTRTGRGTAFEIRLPLTLAMIDGLILGVGGQRFVLPTHAVRESLRPSAAQVRGAAGEPRAVDVRGTIVPLVRLSRLFGIAGAQPDPCQATVVIVEDAGRQVAVQVDELLGKQAVIVKPLGDTFAHVRGVAGGAILGDGRVGLILDAHSLAGLRDGTMAAA